MNPFTARSVFVHGDKARLQKLVTRTNGKMLANQRFSVVMKSEKIKQYSAIPFLFHCSYKRVDGGYHIQYFTTLTLWGYLRLLLCAACIGWLVSRQQLSPYAIYGLCAALYCINHIIQRRHCVAQFEAEYRK